MAAMLFAALDILILVELLRMKRNNAWAAWSAPRKIFFWTGTVLALLLFSLLIIPRTQQNFHTFTEVIHSATAQW